MEFHQPVLLREVLEYMNLRRDDGVYCDCTVGGAGHLMAMLGATRNAKFIGIDCDPEAIDYARKRVSPFEKRCILCEDNFSNLGLILTRYDIHGLDGVLFDLGVSYHQLVSSHRGFSFERDGSLLMCMSPHSKTLAEKIKNATKEEIITVLKQYGDVRNYRKIGIEIFENKKDLVTTLDLRRLIEGIIPSRYLKKNLRKVFQALRIWVNNELDNLEQGLLTAFQWLNLNGRIVVISYHSGEDRIVKRKFHDLKKSGDMLLLNKKVIRPTAEEVQTNPRARSARLRSGEKCVDS